MVQHYNPYGMLCFRRFILPASLISGIIFPLTLNAAQLLGAGRCGRTALTTSQLPHELSTMPGAAAGGCGSRSGGRLVLPACTHTHTHACWMLYEIAVGGGAGWCGPPARMHMCYVVWSYAS